MLADARVPLYKSVNPRAHEKGIVRPSSASPVERGLPVLFFCTDVD